MIFKTLYIQNTFNAGVEVGSLRAHLAREGAGELNIIADHGNTQEVEIMTYNPLIMSYAEDRLAPFV